MLSHLLRSLFALLADNTGSGGKQPDPPQYQADPNTKALGAAVSSSAQGLLNIPYSDLVQRFSPSADTTGMLNDSITKYKGLIDSTDYSTTDFTKTNKDYLDSIMGQYNTQQDKAQASMKESLIANHLDGSGPGYGLTNEFNTMRTKGATDVASQWAYQNEQLQLQEQQYKDALQRGDYNTMYQLALGKASNEVAPQVAATNTQSQNLASAAGIFGTETQADLNTYQAQMAAYTAQQQANAANKKNLGGAGAMAGMAAGALLAIPTGGLSMAALPAIATGAGLGGALGGGIGGMFSYR